MKVTWAKANPERMRALVLAWRAANTERHKKYNAEWQKANKERVHGYYIRGRERRKERQIERNKEHPEKHRARVAAWAKANPEKRLDMYQRRRSRKLGNVGNEPVTKAHLDMLFDAQDGRCRYCPAPLGKDKHLDHRIPLARGGAHAPSNVCWSCPSCNLRKNKKTEQEFMNA